MIILITILFKILVLEKSAIIIRKACFRSIKICRRGLATIKAAAALKEVRETFHDPNVIAGLFTLSRTMSLFSDRAADIIKSAAVATSKSPNKLIM